MEKEANERNIAMVAAHHNANVLDDGSSSGNGRTHQPYARCYINGIPNNSRSGSNTNDKSEDRRTVPSPLQVVTQTLHNDIDDVHVSSPLTVQPRYRLQSPTHSLRGADTLLSGSPSDGTLRSPKYAWSAASSLLGDTAQSRFTAGPVSRASPPVPQEVAVGSRARPPYPGSYAPPCFVMPPALSRSVPTPCSDALPRSPHLDARVTPHRIGSPPAMSSGSGYVSPMLLSATPPYHNGRKSMQSPPASVTRRNGMNARVASGERTQGMQTKNGVWEETSTVSGSSASTLREELLLCPNDGLCTLINDRRHQRKFAHTCRLFPCYHGHMARHGKLFRHAPGQVAETEVLSGENGARKNIPAEALASVNFSSISLEASNAYRIIVSHGDRSYEIFGDWKNVRVHTFKRYLHQVYKIPPTSQVLLLADGGQMLDDDIESVSHYGVKPDTVIILKHGEDDETPNIPIDEV